MKEVIWRFGQKPLAQSRKISRLQFDSLARNIGRLFITFGSLEEEIESILTENLSRSESGDELIYVLISKLTFSQKGGSAVNILGQKIEAIQSKPRTKSKIDKLRIKLNKIEKEIETAGSRRNMYAHARWNDYLSESQIRTKMKVKKEGVFESFRAVRSKEMEKDISAVNKVIGKMTDLDFEISAILNK